MDFIFKDQFKVVNSITNTITNLDANAGSISDFNKLKDEKNLYVSGHIPAAAVNLHNFDNKITIIRDPLSILSSLLSFNSKELIHSPLLEEALASGNNYPIYAPYFASGFDFERFIFEISSGFGLKTYQDYCDPCTLEDSLAVIFRFNTILNFDELSSEIKRLIINEGYFPYLNIPNKRKYKYNRDIETAAKLLCDFDIEFFNHIKHVFINIPSDIDVAYERYKERYCIESGINIDIHQSYQLDLTGPIGIGWHSAEMSDQERLFRWSESGKATLEIPISAPGTYVLQAYTFQNHLNLVTVNAYYYISGTRITYKEKQYENYRVFIFETIIGAPDWLIVEFNSEPLCNNEINCHPENVADTRSLGFILGGVFLRRTG